MWVTRLAWSLKNLLNGSNVYPFYSCRATKNDDEKISTKEKERKHTTKHSTSSPKKKKYKHILLNLPWLIFSSKSLPYSFPHTPIIMKYYPNTSHPYEKPIFLFRLIIHDQTIILILCNKRINKHVPSGDSRLAADITDETLL